ncbi:hypothetical protein [Duganella sp.]|uniref:hypothetical protein n=1 Tax=Duganella sp. TaxID=1904440 RepID=UPI0031D7E121
MDKAAKLRWAFLLTALIGTLAAAFYPVDDRTLPSAPPSGPAPVQPHLLVTPTAPGKVIEDDDSAGDPDPFAPRGWQAAPTPSPVATTVQPVTAVSAEPAPPPGPPPLPFRFVGSLKDGNDQLVYLARGDEAMVARMGEVLEGTYKVTLISATHMEFEHVPTGQKQVLAFPLRDN